MPLSTSSDNSRDENNSFFEFNILKTQDFVYEPPTGKLVTKI
jgi:hypothetical protein